LQLNCVLHVDYEFCVESFNVLSLPKSRGTQNNVPTSTNIILPLVVHTIWYFHQNGACKDHRNVSWDMLKDGG